MVVEVFVVGAVVFVVFLFWLNVEETPPPQGNPPTTTTPGPTTSTAATAPSPPKIITDPAELRAIRLDARKAVRDIDFIRRALGLRQPWSTSREIGNHIHDLGVMLEYSDVSSISLDFLDRNRKIFYCHRIGFGKFSRRTGSDCERGVALLHAERQKIGGVRLSIQWRGGISRYRHRLRLRWTTAENLEFCDGESFGDEHTVRKNAGRAAAKIFVSAEFRREVTIDRVPCADYAFAHSPELAADVYLPRGACDPRFEFAVGQRISFIPIHSPRGWQGRNIRLVPPPPDSHGVAVVR